MVLAIHIRFVLDIRIANMDGDLTAVAQHILEWVPSAAPNILDKT